MGRKLRDKLAHVEFSKDRLTETYWQQLLRDRDTRAKLQQKEYADRTRAAKYSDIEEGDKVLLKQTCDNKLSPTYKPEPYTLSLARMEMQLSSCKTAMVTIRCAM